MTEPVVVTLGAAFIATVAGVVGKAIGSSGKMSEDHCDEKQKACQNLVISKIDGVEKKVDYLTKIFNNKFLGL